MTAFFRDVATCKTCGQEVTVAQVGAFALPDAHDAPCGAPCWGGGVKGQMVTEGRFESLRAAMDASHRRGGCPRCNPKPRP